MELNPGLRVKTVEQLEDEFWELLNSNYNQVLNSNLSLTKEISETTSFHATWRQTQ